MKSIIIVLLVAALAAGAYFYFSKKTKPTTSNSAELILGIWKVDSVGNQKDSISFFGFENLAVDSNLRKYQFEFFKDSTVIESILDNMIDTSKYIFADQKTFHTSNKNDSSKINWTINKLDSLNLVVQKDSSVFSFKRISSK